MRPPAFKPFGAIPLLNTGACFCTPVFRDNELSNNIWIQDTDKDDRITRFLRLDDPDDYEICYQNYQGYVFVHDKAISAFRFYDKTIKIGNFGELVEPLSNALRQAAGVLEESIMNFLSVGGVSVLSEAKKQNILRRNSAGQHSRLKSIGEKWPSYFSENKNIEIARNFSSQKSEVQLKIQIEKSDRVIGSVNWLRLPPSGFIAFLEVQVHIKDVDGKTISSLKKMRFFSDGRSFASSLEVRPWVLGAAADIVVSGTISELVSE